MKTSLYSFLIVLYTLPIFLNAQTVIGENFQISKPDQNHVLLTQSGDQLLGRVLFIQDDTIGFQMRNLKDTIRFSLSEVAFIGDSEQLRIQIAEQKEAGLLSPVVDNTTTPRGKEFPMPTNNLFYSATALNHNAKGTFRNTLLLYNYLERQFSPNISVGAGGFLPGFITLRAQLKKSLTEFVHIGAAYQVFQILVDDQRASHPYAMLTIGDRQKYLNFTYGFWIDKFGFNDTRDTYQMFTAGGSFAFTETWRFYAEVVTVYEAFDPTVLPSFSFSNHRRRNTYEFGLLAIPASDFPLLPLFTYYLSF
jgi:hypothetical protein